MEWIIVRQRHRETATETNMTETDTETDRHDTLKAPANVLAVITAEGIIVRQTETDTETDNETDMTH